MNNYPPYQDDLHYPNQQHPANRQPSWGNAEWGNEQGRPQPDDPDAPSDGYGQYGQQYRQYGQYAPPSQQPQSGYEQYGGQGQYGQYGSPSQNGQSQQGWGYGTPASQSQYGGYGQANQYGAAYQQSSYVPNAAPAPYGYPVPGQQDFDDGYDDGYNGAPPRKSRKGIYTILAIFGAIIAIMVICGVLANIPPPTPANTASIAGIWYGRTNIAADSMGTVAGEAYMDLHQTGTSVTGNGKVCVNRSSKAFEYIDLKIDGSMSGTNATIIWHFENLTNDAKGDAELTGSLTKSTLSLIYQDARSDITLGAQKGTHEEYLAACRQLPAS